MNNFQCGFVYQGNSMRPCLRPKDHRGEHMTDGGITWPNAAEIIYTQEQLNEAVQAATLEKERGVARHILGGATDGCQCEPCLSAEWLVKAAVAKTWNDARQSLVEALWYKSRNGGVFEILDKAMAERGIAVRDP